VSEPALDRSDTGNAPRARGLLHGGEPRADGPGWDPHAFDRARAAHPEETAHLAALGEALTAAGFTVFENSGITYLNDNTARICVHYGAGPDCWWMDVVRGSRGDRAPDPAPAPARKEKE
jgi:hypothetical protein